MARSEDRPTGGSAVSASTALRVQRLEASVYRVPADRPEADATFTWDSTTPVPVEAVADCGKRGLGYTYAASAAAQVVPELLAPIVIGRGASDIGAAWEATVRAVRIVGRLGIARARAVLAAASAVETHSVDRFVHRVGTCRMGSSPADSVVDRWCRSRDVPNLLVCDGSVLPTQGSSNPALTTSAPAARIAEWLRRAAPRDDLACRPVAERLTV